MRLTNKFVAGLLRDLSRSEVSFMTNFLVALREALIDNPQTLSSLLPIRFLSRKAPFDLVSDGYFCRMAIESKVGDRVSVTVEITDQQLPFYENLLDQVNTELARQQAEKEAKKSSRRVARRARQRCKTAVIAKPESSLWNFL